MVRVPDEQPNVVLVDAEGHLLAEAGAQRRLSANPGRFRVVPTTGELVILQRIQATGSSGSGAESSGLITGRVALAGEIDAVGGLIDIIHFIYNNTWSGQLAVVEGAVRKALHFRRGDVRTAASNVPEDRLGAILYRYGVVSEEKLAEALRTRGAAKLGQTLVSEGALSAHDLYTYVRRQVEEIFYSLLVFRKGSFYFYRADEDVGPASQLLLSTKQLLFEGVRRIDELSYFREKLPSPDVVLVRSDSRPTDRLSPREQRVLSLVDGTRDLGAIARVSHLGEFETTKTLYQLLQAGFVQVRKATLDMNAVGNAGRPLSDIAARVVETFNTVYAKIHAAVAARGKHAALERGLESFFGSVAEFAPLFVAVSILPDGTLPRDQVLANLEFAPADDKLDYLHRGLNELLFFELFTAGEAVDRREELELHQRLNEILRDLPDTNDNDESLEVELERTDGAA
jgi:hypothetical protein